MNIPQVESHNYPGKLIVLEAAAASGKDTQTDLLVLWLRGGGHNVYRAGLPRYAQAPYGPRILSYLDNGYGPATDIPAEYASYPYMLDRILANPEITKHLQAGEVVVICRYVLSNLAYQGAKIWSKYGKEAAEKFMVDQYLLEYQTHQLLREDLLMYLDLPWSLSVELLEKRALENGEGRDGQETDDVHMERVNKLYRQFSSSLSYGKIVQCTSLDGQSIRPIADISEDIKEIVRSVAVI